MATQEEIRELAYNIWEKEGHPVGKEVENYFRAKQIIEGRVFQLGASPSMLELAPVASSMKESIQAYCVKCRTKREIRNPQSIMMKNGRSAMQGNCPVCGTKMFRIYKV